MWWGQLFLDGLISCSDLAIGCSFIAVLLKLKETGSSKGLSLQTLVAVISARSLHILSHPIGLHYMPGVLPWAVYPFVDLVNAAIGITCVFFATTQYFKTYEREKDNFGINLLQKVGVLPVGKDGPLAGAVFLYPLVALLGLLWCLVRRGNQTWALSYFCCFYEALSAVALIPQLWMFHQTKRVSPTLALFVVATALNRVFTLTFWVTYPWVHIWRYPDNRGIQIVSETVNLLILSDFLFYWIRSKIRGDTEIIIGNDPMV